MNKIATNLLHNKYSNANIIVEGSENMTEILKTTFANISDLNRGNARKVIEKVKNNTATYIMKNNVPEAVLIPVEIFSEVQEMLLYKIVAERVAKYEANPNKTRTTLEELMKENGITQEDLDELPELEFDYD